MKLAVFATLLPVLLSSAAVFAAPRNILQARQARVKKDLADICVALNTDVDLAPNGHNILAGHINVCLCLSLLPGFLESNPVAKTVASLLGGTDGAHDFFSNLIQSQGNREQCHYPPHSTPACSIKSPCDFTCDNGYTPYPENNPTQCICKWPNTECNGVCGHFPHGCSSQYLSKGKRSPAMYADGKTACGVPNGGLAIDYVDVTSNTESCGGCTTPSPLRNNVADGTNCKDIPNIKEVECDNGVCKVISCKEGFTVSPSKDSCVVSHGRVRNVRGVDVIEDCYNRLRDHHLLIDGLDLVTVRGIILAVVDVLDYDHVLQAFVTGNLLVKVTDLLWLKTILGVDLSVLPNYNYDVDAILNSLLSNGLIVGYHDLHSLKEYLGGRISGLCLDDLLTLLVHLNLILNVGNILSLGALLGVVVKVL